MEPALIVTFLWLVFGGLHVALGSGLVRPGLVARLGELGFAVLFSLVATASFAALVGYYAAHRHEGAAGLALGAIPLVRWAAIGVIVGGFMLAVAGLVAYPRLPSALFRPPIRRARGIERITRHPFFAGVALVAVAHVLLATRLVGTVFTAGFALLAILGARHQDAKLLARRGASYADYLAATSTFPFAAIVAGRQPLAWRDLPVGALAGGLGLAVLVRARHDFLFSNGGAWIVAAVVAGGAIATLQSWRRARRLGVAAVAADAS